MPLNSKQHLYLIICIGLAIAVAGIYLPVWNYEFLHYDDEVYVTNNAEVQSGLSWQGIQWAFTTGHASNWHPLTWLSLMLDCELFGVNSGPMHVVNLLLHIANTILLFIVLARMTKGVWQSAFIAGLFALHPLHIESVAWVAERKDVLSTLFWLLTMLAYAWYVERSSAGRYIITMVLFALGLMAKPMLVTLPFVLLLLDYWPLERAGGRRTDSRGQRASLKWLIIEKIPLIVLSAVSSVVTFIAQREGGAVLSVQSVVLKERFVNAAVSYVAYIGKMLWPARLAVLYPHPVDRIPAAQALICAAVLILITILCLYYVRRHKFLLIGWLWYLGTLIPVIGIVQVGSQAMADRYTYIPLIGIFIMIAFIATELPQKISSGRIIVGALGVIALAACAVVTSQQLKYWQNSMTLFEHTLAVTEGNYLVHNNYANVLSSLGRQEEAAKHLAEALRFLPDSPEIHNNYGNILRETGKIEQAIEQYKIALKLNPGFALARYQLGVALAAKGDYQGAIEQYRLYACTDADLAEICQGSGRQGKVSDVANKFHIVRPDVTEVLSNYGYALAQSGKPEEAIVYYDKVLAKDPNNVITHGRLALALASVGRINEAIEQCRIVLAENPDDFEMYTNLGILLQQQGRLDEAIQSYRRALQINPDFQKAHDCLNELTRNQQVK